MIQIRGLRAEGRTGSALAFWLFVSILCMAVPAALPAGFLFMRNIPPLRAGGNLSAFLHRETPGSERFLRELFIQKKKDGKKRRIPLTAE